MSLEWVTAGEMGANVMRILPYKYYPYYLPILGE